MVQMICQHCSKEFDAQRRTRKFCSQSCANRSSWVVAKKRNCRHCGAEFEIAGAGQANRQHCSKECAKNHNSKRVKGWQESHPEEMRQYTASWRSRNTGYYAERSRRERARILDELGGCCVVCGVTNPLWLHVDLITGSRDLTLRHPRHLSYMLKHLDEFRILCANHHYELTLSGRIEGTSITQ